MQSGIYQIRNLTNDKIYIGSTKNYKKRHARHLRDLRLKEHHCIYLQKSYNKHGENSFVFEVIEECEEADLFNREIYWIQQLKPEYNIGGVCGGDNFTNHPHKELMRERLSKQLRECKRLRKFRNENPNWKGGKTFFTCPKCGKETRKAGNVDRKTCRKCYDKNGNKNPFFGKKHSAETLEKIRKSRAEKPSKNSRKCSIDGILYLSVSLASKSLNMKRSNVLYRLNSENYSNWFFIS